MLTVQALGLELDLPAMLDLVKSELDVFLTADGASVTDCYIPVGQRFQLYCESLESEREIAQHRLIDIPAEVEELCLNRRSWPDEQSPRVTFHPCIFCSKDGTYEYRSTFSASTHLWRSPYDPDEWLDLFRRIMRDHYGSVYDIPKEGSDSEKIVRKILDPNTQIDATLRVFLDDLNTSAYGTTDTLEAAYVLKGPRDAADSLAAYFSFPAELSVACEQYLLYFGEFLRDVGVENTIELKQNAGRVLFAVKPKTKNDALDKIREALEIYLQLPSATFVSSASNNEDELRVQRLTSQIYHLKSQLLLGRATIEQQQETIRLLKYGRILEGPLVEVAKEAAEKPVTEEEKLFGGRLIIKKLEGKGWAINLPQLYRDMRKLFDH